MYYPSNYANDVDVEVHSDENSYCASFDTATRNRSRYRIKHNMNRYRIKHNSHDRVLTKDGVVIAQRVNGELTISPGAEDWVSDWDMTYINAFIKTNGGTRRTKEQIIEMSETGENLLA